MNTKRDSMKTIRKGLKLVARFGTVRLLRDRSGLATMAGDCDEASGEVKEWIAMFGHELVLKNPQRRAGILLPAAS